MRPHFSPQDGRGLLHCIYVEGYGRGCATSSSSLVVCIPLLRAAANTDQTASAARDSPFLRVLSASGIPADSAGQPEERRELFRKVLNMQDAVGRTVAMYASVVELPQILAYYDIDVTAVDNRGYTLAHEIASRPQSNDFNTRHIYVDNITASFRLLAERGLDLSAKCRGNGPTPLALAKDSGAIRALIELGADASARLSDGRTFLHVLAESASNYDRLESVFANPTVGALLNVFNAVSAFCASSVLVRRAR